MPKIIQAFALEVKTRRWDDALTPCCAVAYIPFGLEMESRMRSGEDRMRVKCECRCEVRRE